MLPLSPNLFIMFFPLETFILYPLIRFSSVISPFCHYLRTILSSHLILSPFIVHPPSPIALIIIHLLTILHPSVADPDPPDPHIFGPPGSGSISHSYGSGSFYHHAKTLRKTLIPPIVGLFWTFYL